jgi:hypothetical protein
MRKVILLLMLSYIYIFADGKVLYTIDFSKVDSTDAVSWMKSKGFTFMLDSKDLNFNFKNGRLEIDTKEDVAGLFGVRLSNPLKNIGVVSIEWGVDKFPNGANWAKGNNRLAIGAIFSLGTKKFSSGIPFVKPAPYFLAPFIGQKESVGKTYLGKLYKEGGRYYCVSNQQNKLVVTKFNINNKFQKEFKTDTPPLTAFAFQMNTEDTTGGAKAFIKKITFYSK